MKKYCGVSLLLWAACGFAQENETAKIEYVLEIEKERSAFCGGIGAGIYAMDMSPIRRLISQRENDESAFPDSEETLRITGYDILSKIHKRAAVAAFRGIAYGINKEKFHIGGLIEGGTCRWYAKNAAQDSVAKVIFLFAKTGVLMEQVLYDDARNYISLGADAGVGTSGMGITARKTTNFFKNNDDSYDNNETDFLAAVSGFGFIDANFAYVFSINKYFHLRLDASCGFMCSRTGYGFSGDGYGLVNPSGALSFICGRQQ